MFVCACICVNACHKCTIMERSEAGVTGSCEMPDMGAGNGIWVHSKSNKSHAAHELQFSHISYFFALHISRIQSKCVSHLLCLTSIFFTSL